MKEKAMPKSTLNQETFDMLSNDLESALLPVTRSEDVAHNIVSLERVLARQVVQFFEYDTLSEASAAVAMQVAKAILIEGELEHRRASKSTINSKKGA